MRRAFDLLLGITSSSDTPARGAQTPVRTFRAGGACSTPGAGLACFEVELPYRDAEEARGRGLAGDASLPFVVHAWAADVDAALDCAMAWFEDLRATRPGVRRVEVEPIVRRLGAADGARRVA
jgi:hypothetical protein